MIHEDFFCPNPCCKMHNNPGEGKWYYRNGKYFTKVRGNVQIYVCNVCGKCFSDQTFSLDYYVKREVDYERIQNGIISGSGVRHISNELKISTDTVQNRIARLARNLSAVNDSLLQNHQITENLAADGFESFSLSQYFPHHQNILVGEVSQFLYVNDCVVLRRNGRMTDSQKEHRKDLETIWKANPKGKEASFLQLLRFAENHIPKGQYRTLYTDEDRAYPRALKKIENKCLVQIQVSSKAPRNTKNLLFPCNYMDRLIRKDLANHKRETVQWAKTIHDMMNRGVIHQSFHNYRKQYRINARKEERTTHAQVAGIDKKCIQRAFSQILKKRVFFSKVKLSMQSLRTWFRDWENPLDYANKYVPKYAFM
ncbi:MAG: hypothetical protein ACLFR1_02410 [Spirochaetia bacterium]